MRTLSPTFAARLDGATTLCLCWQVRLRDGTRLGFTDHDGDVVFDGVSHAARSGFRPGDIEQALGFAVSTMQVGGALVHDALSDDDLASGRLDGAVVDTHVVDWQQPDARLLLDTSKIGIVRRIDAGFVAELRSPAQAYTHPTGRLYEMGCSAELGDAHCRVALPPLSTATCDKTHATCRDRFANVVNFRGFPHMPGNDMVIAYARADDVAMDGGSLFR